MLVGFGVLGFATVLALFPTGLAAFGNTALLKTPLSTGIIADNLAAAVAACLGALLFVSGRRTGYIGGGLGLAVAVGYIVARWRIELALSLSGDPQLLFALVFGLVVGTAAVSTLALVAAFSIRREIGEPGKSAGSGVSG